MANGFFSHHFRRVRCRHYCTIFVTFLSTYRLVWLLLLPSSQTRYCEAQIRPNSPYRAVVCLLRCYRVERRRLACYRAECCLISHISGADSSLAYGLSGALCRWAGLAGIPEDSLHVFLLSVPSSSSSFCRGLCMYVCI